MTDEVHFSDVFVTPGAWVGVSFEAPAWCGVLSRRRLPEAKPGSTAKDEVLSLEVSEMPVGMASAWAQGGGWPAFGSRIRAVAAALGGSVELQTFVSHRDAEERHECRYTGPIVEDL